MAEVGGIFPAAEPVPWASPEPRSVRGAGSRRARRDVGWFWKWER